MSAVGQFELAGRNPPQRLETPNGKVLRSLFLAEVKQRKPEERGAKRAGSDRFSGASIGPVEFRLPPRPCASDRGEQFFRPRKPTSIMLLAGAPVKPLKAHSDFLANGGAAGQLRGRATGSRQKD